jgi:hypothetical protein
MVEVFLQYEERIEAASKPPPRPRLVHSAGD